MGLCMQVDTWGCGCRSVHGDVPAGRDMGVCMHMIQAAAADLGEEPGGVVVPEAQGLGPGRRRLQLPHHVLILPAQPRW